MRASAIKARDFHENDLRASDGVLKFLECQAGTTQGRHNSPFPGERREYACPVRGATVRGLRIGPVFWGFRLSRLLVSIAEIRFGRAPKCESVRCCRDASPKRLGFRGWRGGRPHRWLSAAFTNLVLRHNLLTNARSFVSDLFLSSRTSPAPTSRHPIPPSAH